MKGPQLTDADGDVLEMCAGELRASDGFTLTPDSARHIRDWLNAYLGESDTRTPAEILYAEGWRVGIRTHMHRTFSTGVAYTAEVCAELYETLAALDTSLLAVQRLRAEGWEDRGCPGTLERDPGEALQPRPDVYLAFCEATNG